MGKWLFPLFLAVFMVGYPLSVQAPVYTPKQPIYKKVYVRLTAYSSKEKWEGSRTATGKSARNEKGVAVHKSFPYPFGTNIILPDGQRRIIDDKVPTKSAKRFKLSVVDVRYYESIKSQPKTKAVSKELCKKFDKGYDYIWIETKK
ncbi:MAG: hypothetical protein QME51_07150 [Planctomycetota bacterium]|nr:hypothetical protein [Planctomycetota bacterium]